MCPAIDPGGAGDGRLYISDAHRGRPCCWITKACMHVRVLVMEQTTVIKVIAAALRERGSLTGAGQRRIFIAAPGISVPRCNSRRYWPSALRHQFVFSLKLL